MIPYPRILQKLLMLIIGLSFSMSLFSQSTKYKLVMSGIIEQGTQNNIANMPQRTIELIMDGSIIIFGGISFEYSTTLNGLLDVYYPIQETIDFTTRGMGLPGSTPSKLIYRRDNRAIEIDTPMNYGNGLPYSRYIQPRTMYELFVPIE